MLSKLISKSTWGRIKWSTLFFAVILSLCAITQYFFIKYQFQKNVQSQLNAWAKQINEEIDYKGKWNIKNYLRLGMDAPQYIIIAKDIFLDIEGSIDPPINIQVKLSDNTIYVEPKTITTEAGKWRLFGKYLKGGSVILGIPDPDDIKSVDEKLKVNVRKFGSTIEEAIKVKGRDIDSTIHYYVVDDYNNFKSGGGVLPVKINRDLLPDISKSIFKSSENGRYYSLYKPIFDNSRKTVGTIIVYQETDLEEDALKKLKYFTIILTSFLWIIFFSHRFYTWSKSESEKDEIKQRFQNYFSPQIMDRVLKDPKGLELGGQRREVTILFSDIRSFTAITEKLPPKRLIELLQEYFTEMAEEVLATDGVVDKYIGDAIMAFWGAPIDQIDQADRAVQAAINMLERLKKLQTKWSIEEYPLIDIGIGINTGVVTIGNMGSKKRFDYTIIGDEVNVASRLEGLNKKYKSNIIISESTKNKLTIPIRTESLGEETIEGKTVPTKIYKIII